jgi:hypothetical protein
LFACYARNNELMSPIFFERHVQRHLEAKNSQTLHCLKGLVATQLMGWAHAIYYVVTNCFSPSFFLLFLF